MDCFRLERQNADLSGVEFTGKILDIGGGGEGVIARHSGDRVVAIDIRADELLEAPDIGLKIVMDAAKTAFLDACFETVTCFYSLMYMDAESLPGVIAEAFRVLKPGGSLWIWDSEFSAEKSARALIVPVRAIIDRETAVTADYGVGWERGQTARGIEGICANAGFVPADNRRENGAFFLRLIKE